MISRYTRPEMAEIWTDDKKYDCWLAVELAADEAWSKLGHIPAEDVEKLKKNAKFNVERIQEIEAVTHHDVIAFTRCVSESLGDEKKWVHYGLTSTDVVDTAYGYQLKQANDILRQDLKDFTQIVADQAKKYKHTVMMGRTHGVHAEPTTFGLKLARWYSEMKRNMERFEHAAKGVEAGKISGAVGTFANIDPFVEKYVCEKLGIRAQEISSQVLPRDPIGSENICGLARVCRGHMLTAYEDVALWHERDISHSGAERVILPDTTILIDYMLHRFGNILKNLTVFPENMKRNMNRTFGLIYSGRVLLKLIDTGMSREDAYDLIQPYTAKSWDEQVPFRPLLEADPTISARLTKEELDDAFDYHWHLRHVDDIFERVGLSD